MTEHTKKKRPQPGSTEAIFRIMEPHLLKASIQKEAIFNPANEGWKPSTWITYARTARQAWMRGKFTSNILPTDSSIAMVKFYETEDERVLSENKFFAAHGAQILNQPLCSVEISGGRVIQVNQKEPVAETRILKTEEEVWQTLKALEDGSLSGIKVLCLVKCVSPTEQGKLFEMGQQCPSVEVEECAEGFFRLR